MGVNRRAKRRLGCCFFDGKGYRIEVAEGVLNDPETLRETLCHELLHTCPGCGDHGKQWKAYAQRVNEALETNIRRAKESDAPLSPLRREEVRYLLRCERCGREFPRMRMCKVVKTPWRYRCPCGGKLKRVR